VEIGGGVTEIIACGYIGLTSGDLGACREFATLLGMEISRASTGDRLLLRIDERAFRVSIEPGEDGVAYVGWEVANAARLSALATRLGAAGVSVHEDRELAKERGVEALVRCVDPGGNRLEFFHSARVPAEPFISPFGAAFVTSDRGPGDLGFGHVVVTFEDYEAARSFYMDTLGFRVSDICTLPEPWMFAHVNPRHHSLAFGPAPGPSRYHHFMLEVESLDMVGLALDRLRARDAPVVTTLGRHSNDRMVSFYVRSPCGIEVEYGCDGRKIDDTAWTSTTYDSPSIWGHHYLSGPDSG
jgi:3,4-dihydroxy-9,10-secoandrosta-1,3,5(10)-triene-9,17-dione 4,5-dioxygenase